MFSNKSYDVGAVGGRACTPLQWARVTGKKNPFLNKRAPNLKRTLFCKKGPTFQGVGRIFSPTPMAKPPGGPPTSPLLPLTFRKDQMLQFLLQNSNICAKIQIFDTKFKLNEFSYRQKPPSFNEKTSGFVTPSSPHR